MTRALLSLFAVVMIIANLSAAIVPFEQWPLTNAPMFAHYVDEGTPRYSFQLIGVNSDFERVPLGYYSVGAHWSLMRYFFKYVYGSQDFGSVFANFSDDRPHDFKLRLTRFFSAFVNAYLAHPGSRKELRFVELHLNKLAWEDSAVTETKKIAVFDAASQLTTLEYRDE